MQANIFSQVADFFRSYFEWVNWLFFRNFIDYCKYDDFSTHDETDTSHIIFVDTAISDTDLTDDKDELVATDFIGAPVWNSETFKMLN